MKKLLTLCFLTLALCFSTQNITAQNDSEINAAASVKTKELKRVLKFDTNQSNRVYEAFKAYEKTYQKISSNIEANVERKNKIDAILDKEMKEILTEEQYTLYKSL